MEPGTVEFLDFAPYFDHAEHVSAYALTRVYCPEPRTVAVLYGSDDAARVWLNGTPVHESPISRFAFPDREALLVTFRAGWNSLLVRVSNSINTHALYLRLSDAPGDRARALLGAGRYVEASLAVGDALSLRPGDPRSQDLARRIDHARSWYYAGRGQWTRLAADLGRDLELDPGDPRKWFYGAVAQLLAGREDLYQSNCREMLGRFEGVRDWVTAERISKTCLLRPTSPEVITRAAALAERGVGDEPDNPWSLLAASLADLRSGRYESSLRRARRGRDLGASIPPSDASGYRTATFLVETLAHARLGHGGDARRSLDEAHQLMDGRYPAAGSGGQYPSPWADWALCQILRQEADAAVAWDLIFPENPFNP